MFMLLVRKLFHRENEQRDRQNDFAALQGLTSTSNLILHASTFPEIFASLLHPVTFKKNV